METTIMENQMEKKMENEMETGIILGLYMGYIGTMEKKMETLGPFKGICRVIYGLYRDNGKENGKYYDGLYRGL